MSVADMGCTPPEDRFTCQKHPRSEVAGVCTPPEAAGMRFISRSARHHNTSPATRPRTQINTANSLGTLVGSRSRRRRYIRGFFVSEDHNTPFLESRVNGTARCELFVSKHRSPSQPAGLAVRPSGR
jgi:hypothetical protein